MLSSIAVGKYYDDLGWLLAQESLGQSRVYFLRSVYRMRNRITPGEGRGVVSTYANDPDLGG